MRTVRPHCRGAALIYAMIVVLVVSASAAALQTRTAVVIRDARLHRERVQKRLDAESDLESRRALFARGEPIARIKYGPDRSAEIPALETLPDGTLFWSSRALRQKSPAGGPARLEVTLAPAGGRLPRILRWTE